MKTQQCVDSGDKNIIMNILIRFFFVFFLTMELMMSNSQRIATQLCRSPHLFSLFFFWQRFSCPSHQPLFSTAARLWVTNSKPSSTKPQTQLASSWWTQRPSTCKHIHLLKVRILYVNFVFSKCSTVPKRTKTSTVAISKPPKVSLDGCMSQNCHVEIIYPTFKGKFCLWYKLLIKCLLSPITGNTKQPG